MITITKVVSKNIILDWYSGIQNVLGMNLTNYEKMVEKGVNQIKTELAKRNIKLKWYRYQITQFSNGGMAIMLYGDEE